MLYYPHILTTMKKYISLFFLSFILLTACEQEDPELSLSLSQATVPPEGGTVSVMVSCNVSWTATGDPWISVGTPSGGKGTTTVQLTVSANTGSSSRKGNVTFTAGTIKRNLVVTQAPPLSQQLTIVHNLKSFTVPAILGTGMSARVDFGEGEKKEYVPGLKWDYTSSGTHKVVIESAGGTSFTLESIAGVSAIDMSAF